MAMAMPSHHKQRHPTVQKGRTGIPLLQRRNPQRRSDFAGLQRLSVSLGVRGMDKKTRFSYSMRCLLPDT